MQMLKLTASSCKLRQSTELESSETNSDKTASWNMGQKKVCSAIAAIPPGRNTPGSMLCCGGPSDRSAHRNLEVMPPRSIRLMFSFS
jgi:hypothetical protein